MIYQPIYRDVSFLFHSSILQLKNWQLMKIVFNTISFSHNQARLPTNPFSTKFNHCRYYNRYRPILGPHKIVFLDLTYQNRKHLSEQSF